MTRQEFFSQVLAPLGRLTGDEQADVRRELEEHIEDRMEALLEMGWAPELAEERSLEAMGDPAEIGREKAKQYRGRGWVWIGRAAAVLIAMLCVWTLLGLGMLGGAWDSVKARICTDTDIVTRVDPLEASALVDIREPVGNDILRIIRVNVGQRDGGQRVAEVAACMYDRIPGGIAADGLMRRSELKNERGVTGTSGSGSGNFGTEYALRWTPVEPEDTYVVWEYHGIGNSVRLEIPLPKEEAP